MSNKKISELPVKPVPSATDIVPIVDLSNPNNLETKRTTVSALVSTLNAVTQDEKGVAGGIATLDPATGKIPYSQLPVVLDADNVAIDQSITVLAVTQGAYADGTTIPAGTPLSTIIKNMLQTRVAATYTQPTLTIATISDLIYEYGASATLALTMTWAQNDAGASTQFRYLSNTGELAALPPAYPGNSAPPLSFAFSNLTGPITLSGEVTYGTGPLKFDNMGDPSGAPIVGGTKITSNTLALVPRHRRYWGLSSNPSIIDAEILQLNSELATSRAQTRNDFTPASQYIYIAYPESFGLATIKFNGYITTNSWVLTTRNFTNAQGYTASYHIYRTQFTQNSPDIDIEVL